jgi:hypothetical protein
MMAASYKVLGIVTLALFLGIADIPILPVELVAEAEAVFGVRRRTARRTAVVA